MARKTIQRMRNMVAGPCSAPAGRSMITTRTELWRPTGPTTVARAVDLLRVAAPAVYLDAVDATWRAWAASADPQDAPLVPVARQILDACLNPAAANASLTLPDLGGMLTIRAPCDRPRACGIIRRELGDHDNCAAESR